MNLILSIARVSPREDDFKEHKHTLLIDEIQAIAAIKSSRSHGQLDVSPEIISKEMIQLCFNTLPADTITPEVTMAIYLGKWKTGEKKNQFYFQGIFGEPKNSNKVSKFSIILQPRR